MWPEHERRRPLHLPEHRRACSRTSPVPDGRYEPGTSPGRQSVDYTLTNITPDIATAAQTLGATFEKPIHNYHAVEFTLDRRFANNWSPAWRRTAGRACAGNFEGFYRDDNGQSDPGITSLYDFPTNDPSYTAIGVPQFGFRGDIRYLGHSVTGPLPLDRPHQFKVLRQLCLRLRTERRARPALSSGQAADAARRQSRTQLPERRRNSGMRPRVRHSDHRRLQDPDAVPDRRERPRRLRIASLGGTRRVVLLADVFNLFDTQTVLDYDNWTESTFGVLNPEFRSTDDERARRQSAAVSRRRARSVWGLDSSSETYVDCPPSRRAMA